MPFKAEAAVLILAFLKFSFATNLKSQQCSTDDVSLIQRATKDTRHEGRTLQANAELLLKAGDGHGQPVMDDVLSAFNAMGTNGAAIDIDEGNDWPSEFDSYMPPYTYHIEGMQRFRPNPSGGSTYFALSGPGKSASHLFIAELPQTPAAAGKVTGGSSTPTGSIVKVMELDSTYDHGGGFQINGDLLAIGVEEGCAAMMRVIPGACAKKSRVYFYNVSQPTNPVKLSNYIEREDNSAGAVGILKQATGKWLVIAGGDDNSDLDMYVQNDDGSFKKAASWDKSELIINAGVDGGYKSYQTMNLVLQSDGTIFMICTARASANLFTVRDYFDLFTVRATGNGRAEITMVASKPVTARGPDFAAAGAIYVDSSTSMIGYGAPWLPGSSASNPPMPGDTIYANEF